MMKTVLFRRFCLSLVVVYGVLHFLFYFYNLFHVHYVHREFTKKELSEGPLVMKDLPKNGKGKNVISGVYVVNAVQMFDQALSDDSFKTRAPFNDSAPLPKIPVSFEKNLISTAIKMKKKFGKLIYFTFINGAYEMLTMNWICNAANFGKTLDRTLIVTTNNSICTKLKRSWKQISCLHLPLGTAYEDHFEWGKQQYINILTIRANVMYKLIKRQISFVLLEMDAVWFKDPLQLFINQTIIDDADVIVPVKGYPNKGQTLAFDPMVVYPTKGTEALFREMTRRLNADRKAYDQDVLEELCKSQYFGVVCREFEWDEVADGKWFKLSENSRKPLHPYIVNNNYYVGVHNKEARQAINGLWFLTKKGNCARSKVDKMMIKYGLMKPKKVEKKKAENKKEKAKEKEKTKEKAKPEEKQKKKE